MAKDIRVPTFTTNMFRLRMLRICSCHLAFCKSIGLKGRILVADGGINGTVSVTYETTQKYMDYVHSLPGMKHICLKD